MLYVIGFVIGFAVMFVLVSALKLIAGAALTAVGVVIRSEEHTSELQSLA